MTERKSITIFVDLPEHLRDKEMIAESSGAMYYLFEKIPNLPKVPDYLDKDLKTTRIKLSPAAQRYYALLRLDFESDRHLFITAYTLLSSKHKYWWRIELDKYYRWKKCYSEEEML
ncbi:hypothetical protein [Desulfovibrio gilichinskyi]|uniref:Uncharacterized protein n=1 Tax=Desulfovibrio gilichinskyi TaxID=1519643 RepID=A0A1X7E6L5_9BACT|nr:hypothetical protein [Desulfovibrio gilichinskyi]SMF28542.1 hypothetical protein SAMN06295933_2720 [Desulfovibrio gilichinskyi]